MIILYNLIPFQLQRHQEIIYVELQADQDEFELDSSEVVAEDQVSFINYYPISVFYIYHAPFPFQDDASEITEEEESVQPPIKKEVHVIEWSNTQVFVQEDYNASEEEEEEDVSKQLLIN